MKAGLFGGTFNPLHNGHIAIITYVKQAYQLEKIFLFPSATPPHKPLTDLASAQDRMEMVMGWANHDQGFFASDIELKRKGPSFTIDTIEAFKKAHGPDLCFSLIMGSDAFFDIPTWKSKTLIFKAVPIIVMVRGNLYGTETIASFIDEHISKGYALDQNQFVHGDLQPIRICHVPKIDISSTMIRDRIKKNLPITGLVPANVQDLIIKKDLYK